MSEQPRAQILVEEDSIHIWYFGSLLSIKVVGSPETGQFTFVDELLPVGFATPYHVHRNEDETFYVLEGEIEYVIDGNRLVGTPGTLIHFPKHVPHGFRVVGERPARAFNLLQPSGMERLWIEAGRPAMSLTLPHETPKVDISKVTEVSKRLNLENLGPLDLFVKE